MIPGLTSVWLRLEWRRRGRSAVVLALLIAFALGTVLTAVAGARRADSAYDRLAARTLPSTITVLPNQPGFDWDRVRAFPEVEAVTTFVVGGFNVEDPPSFSAGAMPPGDDHVFHGTEVPVVLAGRLYDPAREDEVVVSQAFVDRFGRSAGDRVVLRLGAPDEVGINADSGIPYTGPRIEATIVGVVRSPWYMDIVGDSDGMMLGTPELIRRYPGSFLGADRDGYVNALVRLHGGAAQIEAFKTRLTQLTGRDDIDVWNNADKGNRLKRLIAFEAACLLAFGLAAFGAAVVIIGQAVARYTAAASVDLRALRALGMTPRQAIRAAVTPPLLSAAAGALAGAAAAIVASRWMPMGAAATAEPTPGIDADWPVLAGGVAATAVLVAAGSSVAAWLALRDGGAGVNSGRSKIVATAARLGLPVPVLVGARFALERGRGTDSLPVRPALLSAVVGVLGVLAAFMFSSGVADTDDNPERYGQNYQLIGFFGFNGRYLAEPDPALAEVAADPAVAATAQTRLGVTQAGPTSVTLFGATSPATPWQPLLTEGRPAADEHEVVLAVSSARRIGVGVGDDVTLTGPLGHQVFRVTGLGFVPAGPHNGYDEGGVTTGAGYDRLFPPGQFKFLFGLVTLKPGADAGAVAARLNERLRGSVPERFALLVPDPPEQLGQMRGVESLPIMLGAFLGLLALGAAGHALVTAVRRRRQEMAVLRAHGMTRWQARGVVLTQATILALTGLLFGLPLGFVLGRALWRIVADTMPFFYHPPLALLALLLIGPLTLLAVNLLAVWPARLSTRTRVGHVLRTE